MKSYRESAAPKDANAHDAGVALPSTYYVVRFADSRYLKSGYSVAQVQEATPFVDVANAVRAAIASGFPQPRIVRVAFTETDLTNEKHREACAELAQRMWP